MTEKRTKTISPFIIMLVGNLIVNLPVTLIILITAYILINVGLQVNFAFVLGAIIGWLFWDKLLKVWKNWAFSRGVSPERLFKLGKLGLINFFRSKIIDDHVN